jgi:hypothetical protein
MREVSVGTNHTAGVKQTVYTVPDKHYAKWNLLYLMNNGSSNKTASVWWYDSSAGVEIEVMNTVTVTNKQYIKMDGGAYVVMEEGDEIRIQTESGSTIVSINTFELIPSRSTRN